MFATSVNGQHLNGGACGTEEKTGGPIIVLNPEEGSLHTLFHEIKHMEDKAKGVNVPNELEILKGEMTPERYRLTALYLPSAAPSTTDIRKPASVIQSVCAEWKINWLE